jgi:hypothetical protein
MPDTPGVPRDRGARPSLEAVLELRRDRMSTVRQVIEGLTGASLDGRTEPVEGPGWPQPRSYPVRECLLCILNKSGSTGCTLSETWMPCRRAVRSGGAGRPHQCSALSQHHQDISPVPACSATLTVRSLLAADSAHCRPAAHPRARCRRDEPPGRHLSGLRSLMGQDCSRRPSGPVRTPVINIEVVAPSWRARVRLPGWRCCPTTAPPASSTHGTEPLCRGKSLPGRSARPASVVTASSFAAAAAWLIAQHSHAARRAWSAGGLACTTVGDGPAGYDPLPWLACDLGDEVVTTP